MVNASQSEMWQETSYPQFGNSPASISGGWGRVIHKTSVNPWRQYLGVGAELSTRHLL